jgi:hypothetical protein
VAAAITALDLLAAGASWSPGSPSLLVVHGDEPFLAGQVLAVLRDRLCPDEDDRAWAWREFAGDDELDPRDVFDEAATVPLFATATRVAVVRNADAFVSAARERLEAVAAAPRGGRGLVVLEVRSFPISPAGSGGGPTPVTARRWRPPRPPGCSSVSAASWGRSTRPSRGWPPPVPRGNAAGRSRRRPSTSSPARPRSGRPGG